MATAYLSLGCNKGDCQKNISAAVKALIEDDAVTVASISSTYVTEPVGYQQQPDFLNMVVELDTTLSPHELLELCQRIEFDLGAREDRIHWGPRTIDLDILLYEQVKLADERLKIPHPRMLERAFVLEPLAEIAPCAGIPGNGTVSEALNSLNDEHRVEKRQKPRF